MSFRSPARRRNDGSREGWGCAPGHRLRPLIFLLSICPSVCVRVCGLGPAYTDVKRKRPPSGWSKSYVPPPPPPARSYWRILPFRGQRGPQPRMMLLRASFWATGWAASTLRFRRGWALEFLRRPNSWKVALRKILFAGACVNRAEYVFLLGSHGCVPDPTHNYGVFLLTGSWI